jgi:hypothetical protein
LFWPSRLNCGEVSIISAWCFQAIHLNKIISVFWGWSSHMYGLKMCVAETTEQISWHPRDPRPLSPIIAELAAYFRLSR